MVDAITTVPVPTNEPVLSFAPGSPERATIRGNNGGARL